MTHGGRGESPPFLFFVKRTLLPLLLVLAGACDQPQSEICQQYIACQQEFDAAAGNEPRDVSQYEADGLCWDSAENADACDQQCADGIAANAEAASNAVLDVASCT